MHVVSEAAEGMSEARWRARRFRSALWAVCLVAAAGALTLGCAGGTKRVDSDAVTPSASAESPGVEAPDKPDGHARVQLFPAGRDPVEVDSEVVYTSSARQQGLMYRKELGSDAGMLFLFETERELSFWMHNTYIPLDMIFIRNDMTVLGVVENAEPLTDVSRKVPGRSQYVLEVNAGYCRGHGVVAGTRAQFDGVDDEFDAMPGLSR